MIAVGIFGLTLVGIGLMENAGWKVNENTLGLAMSTAGFGGILYILKIVSVMFL